jgi:hypothetical protein
MSWLGKRRSKRLDSIVDEFIESYVSWREACEEVRAAYAAWKKSAPAQRALEFRGVPRGARP